MNIKKLGKIFSIAGAIMIILLLFGAFANAYGANIKIWYITDLSPFLVLAIGFIVVKNRR